MILIEEKVDMVVQATNIQNLQLYGNYYHVETNNLYIVTGLVKMKFEDGRWVDAVEYRPVFADSNGMYPTYVRSVNSFVNNFRNA